MGGKASREKRKHDDAVAAALAASFPIDDGGPVDFERLASILRLQIERRRRQQVPGDEHGGADLPVARRGVRLEYLIQWLGKLVDQGEQVTTRDVVANVIRPQTQDSRQCLWEQLPASEQGMPKAAISHAWDYPVRYLRDMLVAAWSHGHAPLSGCSFVWIDLFALTQHADASGLQREEIAQLGTVFGTSVPFVVQVVPSNIHIMRRVGHVRRVVNEQGTAVAFSSGLQVQALGCFDRAWCVFEFACAVASGARFDVACPDANTDYAHPIYTLGAWTPQAAQALHDSDRETIRDLVLETFGTWNTLKALFTMVQLKANNVGPITRWDASYFRMCTPWHIAFSSSSTCTSDLEAEEEDRWGTFMSVYRAFYNDEI